VSLRAVIATYDDAPPIGGQGRYVCGLRAGLRRRGVEVRTVAGHGDGAVHVPPVTRRPPLDHSLALTRDPRPLLAGAPDVIHVMGGPGGVILPRRLATPVVYTAHHTYRQAFPRRSPRRILSPVEARAYRLAAMVLAVSPSTADAVLRLGVRADRVEVLAPGIEVGRFDGGVEGPAAPAGDGRENGAGTGQGWGGGAPEATAARAADGTGARTAGGRDPGRLLYVGRLEAEKRPLDAVAVMAELARRYPGVRGTVIGRGRLDDAVRVAASGAPAGAVEVRGAVSESELARAYAEAAVLVVPSRYEGLGLVALEAMAAGVAVVAYDVSGLRDAVRGRGTLVPAGDRAAMARACAEFVADPAARAELAARACAAVRAEHSWDAVAARVEAVYRAVG
jgi:glycosyltransferase involved in cell wall biosynthesis